MKNLIKFNDFKNIKESIDTLDDFYNYNPDITNLEKVEKIKNRIDELSNDDIYDLINDLRDILLEMEESGLIDENTTDNLDDEFENDWNGWIESALQLPELPEKEIDKIFIKYLKNN